LVVDIAYGILKVLDECSMALSLL